MYFVLLHCKWNLTTDYFKDDFIEIGERLRIYLRNEE